MQVAKPEDLEVFGIRAAAGRFVLRNEERSSMKLKEKMKAGPVFGVAIFTGAACAVEAVGNLGYDFVFLDLEHTPLDAGAGMEKLIMAALRTP